MKLPLPLLLLLPLLTLRLAIAEIFFEERFEGKQLSEVKMANAFFRLETSGVSDQSLKLDCLDLAVALLN